MRCVSISGQENGRRNSQKSKKKTMQSRAYLRPAEEQLTVEKQLIAETLCMARPSVLHTGNSSSCHSSPVSNEPSLVSHAWLSGDPMETGGASLQFFQKDITWIQNLGGGANSEISSQAIPAQRYDTIRYDEQCKKILLKYNTLCSVLNTRNCDKIWFHWYIRTHRIRH